MKKVFEKTIYCLERGLHVVLQHDDGNYEVISSFKDLGGDYRRSGDWNTPEEAKQNMCGYYGHNNLAEIVKNDNYEFIEAFHILPAKRYKEGEKVIYKTAEGEIEILTIKCEDNNNCLYEVEENEYQYDQSDLIPYFEEIV